MYIQIKYIPNLMMIDWNSHVYLFCTISQILDTYTEKRTFKKKIFNTSFLSHVNYKSNRSNHTANCERHVLRAARSAILEHSLYTVQSRDTY